MQLNIKLRKTRRKGPPREFNRLFGVWDLPNDVSSHGKTVRRSVV